MKPLIISGLFCIFLFGPWARTAEAIPIAGDYTISSPFLNGTFTSTGTALSAWNFFDSLNNITWSGLPVSPTNTAIELNTSSFFDQLISSLPPHRTARVQIIWAKDAHRAIVPRGDEDVEIIRSLITITPISAAIPEPSTVLLFATGLLALEGYRWRQRRRERIQVR